MGLKKVIVLFTALVALSTCTAFIHVTPHDREVIYNWNAVVKAGTMTPTNHASLFRLNGRIHLQADDNGTYVKITDLSYELYNGKMDHKREHEVHSKSVQVQDLERVFKVVHDPNGLAVGIETHRQEKEFARNMHKAIATILQMDHCVFTDSRQHHCSLIKEHSIYGRMDVDYSVEYHDDEVVQVHKMHYMRDPQHLYSGLVSNVEPGHCDEGFEFPLMHDSTKDYVIVRESGRHIVKNMKATGAIVYQPLKGKSESQFIFVNQTLHLSQVVPIQERFRVEDGHFEDHLTYHPFTDVQDGALHDVTNGRHVPNFETLIPTVQRMLEDIHSYMHEDHLHTREPNSKQGQLVNRCQRLLAMFTLTKLEELHKKLTDEPLRIFHHMLPLIGSQASVLFIKKLVVSQVVSSDRAVEMLQHLPERVVEPTIELLTQMEQLMYLDHTQDWTVRKTAILCFASLIHKSHIWTLKVHQNQHHDHHVHHTETYDHQQVYEKYVVRYVDMFKNSNEFEVQMTYACGLSNMRLHSIIKHLSPVVTGEWTSDRDIRLLGLWAVATSTMVDPNRDTMMETLWPIFTNISESTELRTVAFYSIMECLPNDSLLNNMVTVLLKERNQEVYSFVYTYLRTRIESCEPCRHEYNVKIRHLVKLLPPPTHGISMSHLQDYKDVNFGFSEGLQTHFVNGNHSLIFALQTTSQHFNIYRDEYLISLKIDGLGRHGGPLQTIDRILNGQLTQNNQELRIECTIMRGGQVIATYFLDHQNVQQNDILNFINLHTHSVTKKMLDMSYDEHHQLVVPTDLGTPAIWEYLVPVVYHNNISMTKHTNNKVMRVHIDNRFVKWMHYRHGLSFYNPVVDIWQGINRYHSHDVVIPLHLDLTINRQQKSYQLSWRRSNNVESDVWGLRSHVKQMVFFKDDDNSRIWTQSCPKCDDFVIVSHGKDFRHDYTLIDNDDLTTGQRWYTGAYDSSRHVSNGSINHLMYLFTQSHSKHHESPLDYLLTTCAHWYRYAVLLPKPGTYGYIVKVEPSHKYQVSGIDLSFRLNSDVVTYEPPYTPKMRWSTRMTYSVKNQEHSLKTWDVNAIIDMNQGHTINNLKMDLTRIIPGQKDYKICIDGVKKWTQRGVEGHLNVEMSQSPDGRCVKDDTVIDVTMSGHNTREQASGKYKYGTCEVISPYSVPHTHSLQCLADHTTVRKYVYNVKTTNVPTEFRKVFARVWDYIKGYYVWYYKYEDEHNENIPEQNLKVEVVYPMQIQEVDVHVTTAQHVYRLTGVPNHIWKHFGVYPDSLHYPKMLDFLHAIGWVDHCVLDSYQTVPTEWTLYVGDESPNPQKAVYVKRTSDGTIGVKVVDQGHTFEIVPKGTHDHQITIDGEAHSTTEYIQKDWCFCHVFVQDTHLPVSVIFHNSGLHIEYQHGQLVVLVPKLGTEWRGRCYDRH